MKVKLRRVHFSLFIIAIVTGFLVDNVFSYFDQNFLTKEESTQDPNVLLHQVVSCPQGENEKSYNCTVPYIATYLKDNEIGPFLDLLGQKSQNNQRIASYCHSLGHSIGRALYQTYGYTEALSKCSPFCADGCTMGVMEKFLATKLDNHLSIDLVIENANDACEDFANGDPVKLASCIHGTGHGIMPLVLYDTQDALDLCSKMQTKDKGSCYDAVFMEKFLPSDDARKVAETKNMYEYCASYENEEYRFRCFGYLPYAWQDWGKTTDEVFSLCSTPDAHTEGCGWALVRLYLPDFITKDDLTFFELYHKAPSEMQDPMYKYSSILLVEYSPAKSFDFCKNMDKPEQDCMSNMRNIAQSMDIKIP